MSQVEDLKPLTSLRFVAAMMIVVYHASNYFPWAAPAHGLPLNHGVSFFFVLSGFILTHVYTSKPASFRSFIRARLARIWPIHLVTCLMVLAFIRADSQQLPGTGFFDPWVVLVSNLTLTHALVPYINYTFSWNAVSWSISTELFFYLAFPLLLISIGSTWHWKLALIAFAIPAYGLIGWAFNIPATSAPEKLDMAFMTYASPLFRGFEFMIGMASWVAWQKLGRLRVGLIAGTALEALVLTLLAYWALKGYYQIAPTFQFTTVASLWYFYAGSAWICAVLIITLASGHGLIGKALSWRPFVWLGEISFALYMVHQILMKWMYLKNLEGKQSLPGPMIALGACLIGAALLHHLVENPARRLILGQWKPWKRQGESATPPVPKTSNSAAALP